MKRLIIIILLLFAVADTATAQRISHSFNNVSMSDALKYIQQQTSKHKIIFIYNELEDFMVTTSVKGKSVPDAIKQVSVLTRAIATSQVRLLTRKACHWSLPMCGYSTPPIRLT